jgi:Sulfatase-modifying factor enzyme 1
MLPVVRHDRSTEPKVLILKSDGWECDLSELQPVLDAWIQQDCPALGQSEAEDKRPQLRCDEDESAGDEKTVVIRAWTFKSEWADSLASRLGREFPFLWRLEVGRKPRQLPRYEWDDTFIHVPEKSFQMDDGSTLKVESFEIARHPVSIAQFMRFVDATSYATSAEKQHHWKNFRHLCSYEEDIPDASRVLSARFLSHIDCVAYCEWARVRLPTEMEYLAAWLLDVRAYERGPEAFRLQDDLRKSPEALQGSHLNFTSTRGGDGRVIYRNGPLVLRYVELPWMGPVFRKLTTVDSWRERITLRVCKKS